MDTPPVPISADVQRFVQVYVARNIGPNLIGVMINWAGLGMLVHQVHAYATYYHHKDPYFIKWLVYVVLVCEMGFTVLLTHFVYGLTIGSWGDFVGLQNPPWSAKLIVLCNSYIPIAVQSFFAWRIWMFNQRAYHARIAAGTVWLLALCQTGLCTAYIVKFVEFADKWEYIKAVQHPLIRSLITSWLTAASVANFINAATMVTSLMRSKQRDGRPASTIAVLNQLILMALETGVVTSIVTLIALGLFVHPQTKETFIWAAPVLCAGKFYATMLLANLNGRRKLEISQKKALSMVVDSTGVELQPSTFSARSRLNQTGILVSTTVENYYSDDLESIRSRLLPTIRLMCYSSIVSLARRSRRSSDVKNQDLTQIEEMPVFSD